MAKKDPAFLFYPSDFLTGTMFMNNEQIGIYIRLLCSQHQHGGIIDKLSFDSLVTNNFIIKSKFIECNEGYYNERLANEMQKRNKKSNNLSDAAKVVWETRKIQLHNKSKENEYNSNTKVKENYTIVIQPINRNESILNNKKGISIINQYFLDFENGSQIVDMANNLKIKVELLKSYIPEFRKKVNSEYPTYGKFVDHFRNCFLKRNEKQYNNQITPTYKSLD